MTRLGYRSRAQRWTQKSGPDPPSSRSVSDSVRVRISEGGNVWERVESVKDWDRIDRVRVKVRIRVLRPPTSALDSAMAFALSLSEPLPGAPATADGIFGDFVVLDS